MEDHKTVEPLFEGPLDIIGDIHGERTALESLLRKLGYDDRGRHREGRRLVFIGDLVDRGPDSPGVLRTVIRLVESGNAQCVVGNHELNALRDDAKQYRSGEGWWYGRDEPGYDSVVVERQEKERVFTPFLRRLPAAVERADLRVVHACWHAPSIETVRTHQSVIDCFHQQHQALVSVLGDLREKAARAIEASGYELRDRRNPDRPIPMIPELAAFDERNQMGNAAKVVTSGIERTADEPFWASGKWRLVERLRWWDEFDGTPVVVGHYWRRYHTGRAGRHESDADLFGELAADQWLGRHRKVMCIDYSVGLRFQERKQGREPSAFDNCLAALRVPEWRLVFDDGRAALQLPEPGH
ncbi:MAG: metallophosphoesterase [Myxococcota bacterium]|nr:metallophosphoesterase [Myxococcota bacterium]